VPALTVLEGTLDDPSRMARIIQAATEALQWRGYAKARIEVTRETQCFTDLHVAVTLGPRYKITRIAFTDASLPQAQRLAALEDALGTVNTIGGVLIEYRLRRALDGLAKRYRDAGWLDVDIGEPAFAYAGSSATVTIPIVAGERYRVRVVRAVATKASVREKLLAELAITPGDYYDAPAVRRALERVRRAVDRHVQLRTSAIEDEHAVELEVESP
jgi:outer membrane protein assembly factor BamA